ncbi:tape measure protein [Lactobacillus mulieris]|uniref:Tape measure protein n=1 Tax=Lactobacillus mulieris TaxID=2508708 RepID=A0ABT4K1F1_9LACO|nr:tape measure protein [Lactobacillus mulieris]MCZ3621865.1 tape measure protein [Lactobacillus mulieris]MCZ3623562.1 tape measure protein [Lactobacillus mulieris]MCZ3635872.1 tape measure protein [Lactobacillus mulieris]
MALEAKAKLVLDDSQFTKTCKNAESSISGLARETDRGVSSFKGFAIAGAAMAVVNRAIDVVKDNLGAAIQRFDTLNKYPVVMKALGYSTKDVASSTKLLVKGIEGLPTSLQDITSVTQQLAPLTGSAKKAAQSALALNNAFLASGASGADASRGLLQYTQMLSTGKVDLMSYRTLMETMPIALRKVANAFGFTGKSAENDLYKALQSGQITMDQLNNKFIELNKGVGGFAELAKKNSAGIQTSFENLKNATVKNLANMLTAIDNGFKEAGLGSIAQTLDRMKDNVNSTFTAITPVVTKATKVILKLVTGLQKLSGKPWFQALAVGTGTFAVATNGMLKLTRSARATKGALEAFKTGWKAFKEGGRAAEGVKEAKVALEGFSKESKIATAIQWAFNAAVDANPLMWIPIAIAAVVAALVWFFGFTDTGKKMWSGFLSWLGQAWNAIVNTAKAVWNGLGQFFGNLWNNIVNVAKTAWNGIKDFFSPIVDAIKNIWDKLKDFFSQLWNGIVQGISSAWNGVASFFSQLWNGIVQAIQPYWQQFLQSIQPVIDAFKNLWSALQEFFSTLWNLIVTIATTVWSGLVAFFGGIVQGIIAVWNSISSFFISLWQGILAVTQVAWQGIVAFFTPIIDGIKIAWGGISQFFQSLWQGIQNVINGAVQIISQIITSFLNGVQVVWNAIWTVLSMFVQSVWQDIQLYINTYITIISSIISTTLNIISTIWNTIWNVIWTVLVTIWNMMVNTVATIINAMAAVIRAITAAIKGNWTAVWNAIMTFAITIWTGIGTVVNTGVNGIRTIINTVMNAVLSIFVSIWNSIKSVFNAGVRAIKSAVNFDLGAQGRHIMNSFLNGLKAVWNTVKDFVGGIGNWIKSHKGPESYDKRLLIPAGRFIMGGLAQGLKDNFTLVKDQVNTVNGYFDGLTFALPNLDAGQFNASLDSLNNKAYAAVSGAIDQEISFDNKPAYITLSLGGQDFETFVDDISKKQDEQVALRKKRI